MYIIIIINSGQSCLVYVVDCLFFAFYFLLLSIYLMYHQKGLELLEKPFSIVFYTCTMLKIKSKKQTNNNINKKTLVWYHLFQCLYDQSFSGFLVHGFTVLFTEKIFCSGRV